MTDNEADHVCRGPWGKLAVATIFGSGASDCERWRHDDTVCLHNGTEDRIVDLRREDARPLDLPGYVVPMSCYRSAKWL